MCGIVGWINFEQDLSHHTEDIKKMTATLIHRGPDAGAIHCSEHALLGHRRLSIIDLGGGGQPMTKQGLTIVYNGELYNTATVRDLLLQEGHQFSTTSDTEVILTAFIEWREQCVNYFNGIFAFAIWDDDQQNLFLCRDHLGIKPLFYKQLPDGILFSSEIKALLSHPNIKAQVDYRGLAALLSLGPSRTPGDGIFKDILELKPGYAMTVTKSQLKCWRYWDIQSKTHTHSLSDTVEQVRCLVTEAIQRQLMSDVPLCTMLSGGLDSSIITAVAAQQYAQTNQTLSTFSVNYEGNDQHFKGSAFQVSQDGYWIEKMQQAFQTKHQEIILKQDQLVQSLKDVLYMKDMPSMADIDGSLYLFCKEIGRDFTVALSGECADEVFGGYPWFHEQEDQQHFPWLRSTKERQQLLTPLWQDRLKLAEYMHNSYEQTVKEMPHFVGDATEVKRQQLFYLNNMYFMQTLIERSDRMSMGASIEVRVPFADYTVMEYVWNIPWEMKMAGGMEKGILRRAFEDILPRDVVYRKKNPYPKTYHPAYTIGVQQELRTILNHKKSVLHELFNQEKLHQLLESGGKSFTVPWFGQLMAGPQLIAYLIQLHYWFDHYEIEIVPF
ncbi:MAG: asparagine synthase (glutamine-hydrolyzing) [Solibacillus sp.]